MTAFLLTHMDQAGLGHVSEIADGGTPYTPRGCPCQGWSAGELLRVLESVLADLDVGGPDAVTAARVSPMPIDA
jgi:glycogen debranching enzyme